MRLDKICPAIVPGGKVELALGAVQDTAVQDAGPGQVVTMTVTLDPDDHVLETDERASDNTCRASMIIPSLDDSGVPAIPEPDRGPPGPPR